MLNAAMPRPARTPVHLSNFTDDRGLTATVFQPRNDSRIRPVILCPSKYRKKKPKTRQADYSKTRFVHFVPITGGMLHYSFHLGRKDKTKVSKNLHIFGNFKGRGQKRQM